MTLRLTPLGETFTLAPEPNDGTLSARYPDVAAIGDGRIVVAYEEYDADRVTRVVSQRFDIASEALAPAEEIGDGSPTSVRYARAPVSVDRMTDGSYTIFWLDEAAAVGRRYAPDGTEISASAELAEVELTEDDDGQPIYEFRVKNASSGYDSGGTIVSKFTYIDPSLRLPLDDDAYLRDPRTVLEFDVAPQEGGALTLSYVYLGTTGGGYDIGFSTYGEADEVVPTDRDLAEELFTEAERAGRQQNVESATLENGLRVLVWHDLALDGSTPSAVKMVRVDAEGAIRGGVVDVAVSNATDFADPMPSVTALEDGGFAVAWTARDAVESTPMAQIYDGSGRAQGAPLALGVPGGVVERAVELAPLPGGGFWAVWQSFDVATGEWQIGGRMVDATGSPVGGPQILASDRFDSLFDPALDVHGDGTVSVVWREADNSNENLIGAGDEIRGVSLSPVLEGDGTGERLDLGGTVSHIRGAGGNDWIVGSRLADTLEGGTGADTLIGQGGEDVLTGDAGRDLFAFRLGDADGPARITDFGPGDRLAFDDRFFGLGDGSIDPRAPTRQEASDALSDGVIRYDGRTGELSIDRDGRDGPGAPEPIVVIEGGGRISQDDVLLF